MRKAVLGDCAWNRRSRQAFALASARRGSDKQSVHLFYPLSTGYDAQWSGSVFSSNLSNISDSMTITQYLGTGSKSRGRMVITKALNTRVATSPYLNDAADKAAVIQGLENVQKFFQPIANLTWVRPASDQNASAYIDSVWHCSFHVFCLSLIQSLVPSPFSFPLMPHYTSLRSLHYK